MGAEFYSLHMLLWREIVRGPGDPCAEIRLMQLMEDIAGEENQ